MRVDTQGTIAFYEALGPGPWDPQPGAYIGTWTYDGHISDQAPPNEAARLAARHTARSSSPTAAR